MRGSSAKTFRNWAGNQICLPTTWARPSSTDAVAQIVAQAASQAQRVKVVGAGHSFSDVACTTGVMISLDEMTNIIGVDRERGRVEVQAGIRLDALNTVLDSLGLAMPNLGDIAVQSIGGAIATATHGTGRRLGNLATAVVGFELVDGSGNIIRVTEEREPELLRIGRVSLGALGVITAVTLQCVPAFNLAVAETIEPLDDLLDGWAEHTQSNDHFEFFWVPGARRAQVKRNNRSDDPLNPPSKLTYVKDKIIAENLAFGVLCRLGRLRPQAIPTVAKLVTSVPAERRFVDRSFRVFPSPRHVRFYEMEYAIDIDALPAALREVRAMTQHLGQPMLFPVEVRCSAADDIALSTAQGRDSAWIAVHVYKGMPFDAYFNGVETIMNRYEGRPHWGKMHFQTADTLRPRYPQWDRFMEQRVRLDPAGTFANGYTDRVLGPIDKLGL